MLSILGIFVIYAARAENDNVQTEDLLSRYKARDVMRPHFTHLRSNDWMLTAIETLLHGLERHFLVFDVNDRPVQWLHGLYRPDRYEYQMEISQVGSSNATISVKESLSG